jgi:hypothetical protein
MAPVLGTELFHRRISGPRWQSLFLVNKIVYLLKDFISRNNLARDFRCPGRGELAEGSEHLREGAADWQGTSNPILAQEITATSLFG